jgi:transcriptional regulator with XRE-family HTH domain
MTEYPTIMGIMKTMLPSPPKVVLPITDAKVLGEILRQVRKESGMTLVDTAESVGIAKQTLSDLENGRVSVGINTVLKIANDLGLCLFAVPRHEQNRIQSILEQFHSERS